MVNSTPLGLRYSPFLLVFSIGYMTFGYASVPMVITSQFEVGLPSIGLLMSMILLAYGLIQIPSGWIVNTSGTIRVLLVGTVLHIILAVLLDLAPTFESLLALRFIWGVISGLLVTAGATHIARLYPGDAATRMQGIYGGVLTTGGAFGFFTVPIITARTGWFGIHAIGGLLAFPVFVRLAPYARVSAREYSELEPATDGPGANYLSRILRDRTICLVSLCYAAILVSYITLSTFVTSYFEDTGVLVSLNAFILLIAGMSRAIGGIGAKRLQMSDSYTIIVAATLAALGFVVLARTNNTLLAAVAPMVIMFSVSVPFGAVYNIASKAEVGDGLGLGVVLAVGNLIALLFPPIAGVIREISGGYADVFLLLAGVNIAAVGAGIALNRTDAADEH